MNGCRDTSYVFCCCCGFCWRAYSLRCCDSTYLSHSMSLFFLSLYADRNDCVHDILLVATVDSGVVATTFRSQHSFWIPFIYSDERQLIFLIFSYDLLFCYLRLIATFHLYAAADAAQLPATWDPPLAPNSLHHINFNSLRVNANATPHNSIPDPVPQPNNHSTHKLGPMPWDEHMISPDTRELKLLMSVFPQWGRAVETHNFWNVAITLIDPHGQYAHFAWLAPPSAPSAHSSATAPAPIRVSAYRHFRTLLSYAWLPCRLNTPISNHGLQTEHKTIARCAPAPSCSAKTTTRGGARASVACACATGFWGAWPSKTSSASRRRRSRTRSARCGRWGRYTTRGTPQRTLHGRRARRRAKSRTTRTRRRSPVSMRRAARVAPSGSGAEWLWRCAVLASAPAPSSNSTSTLALSNTTPPAPEDAERRRRFGARRGAGRRRWGDFAAALEVSLRELALGDWARGRMLDGAWVAPADVYYGLCVGGLDTPEDPVKAVYPVPWAVSPPSSPAASLPPSTDEARQHPATPGPAPPSYALTEAAHTAHTHQMRAILPVFRNVVRRIIVECALDAAEADDARLGVSGTSSPPKPLDPAVRAARMPLADVVRELREEGVWFDGVDWSERRRNARAEAEAGAGGAHRTEGSDDSSDGTSSRTNDTSPVLLTSTLGTTPSPPPLGEHGKDDLAEEERRRRQQRREVRERQPTIAVIPVLDPPSGNLRTADVG
ncbi:hypothetical protein B0H17DRAFT_681945 [Mycena rosella]|uniref:Uncharacterized protein n=1 Tax=Mycena rosella TaxID=1033263 RepID=A0AAD7DBP7_MYCRO|nr:hypothetical protein B0H17DRAFT_681945 [Mycena rosella]